MAWGCVQQENTNGHRKLYIGLTLLRRSWYANQQTNKGPMTIIQLFRFVILEFGVTKLP